MADERETMGEFWGGVTPYLKEASRARRQCNRERSSAILTEHGVPYEVKNNGAHLVVTHPNGIADFWPGTGLYQMRANQRRGRGVFNLLRALKVEVQPRAE